MPPGARAVVVTVSDRASSGAYADRSGPLLAELLRETGIAIAEMVVVPDDVTAIMHALHSAVEQRIDLVVTTGGTGLAPRDVTPEATRRVIDHEIPGIGEALRLSALDRVPTAMLSRGVAGVARRTLVVNLPGSTGGVRDGVAVLAPVLAHALAQLRGGSDHEPAGRQAANPPPG